MRLRIADLPTQNTPVSKQNLMNPSVMHLIVHPFKNSYNKLEKTVHFQVVIVEFLTLQM